MTGNTHSAGETEAGKWFSEDTGINVKQVRNALIFLLVLVLGYFIFFREKEKRESIE